MQKMELISLNFLLLAVWEKKLFILKMEKLISSKVLTLAFNNTENKNAFLISQKDNKLFFHYNSVVICNDMLGSKIDSIKKDSLAELKDKCLYNINGVMLVLNNFYRNADIKLVSNTSEEEKGSRCSRFGCCL